MLQDAAFRARSGTVKLGLMTWTIGRSRSVAEWKFSCEQCELPANGRCEVVAKGWATVWLREDPGHQCAAIRRALAGRARALERFEQAG